MSAQTGTPKPSAHIELNNGLGGQNNIMFQTMTLLLPSIAHPFCPFYRSFSVAVIIAALAGPQWLYTEEKMVNDNYNGTLNYEAKDHGAYVTKYTKSSLWILCSRFYGELLT